MSYDAESPAKASGPRPQRIFWVVLAVLAAAVFVQLVLRPRGPGGGEARRHPAVGSKLVGLHVVPLTGEGDDVYLSSLEGDVTMLNFWGTWCPPCRQEFPHVAALYDHFADRDDFRLLAVSYPGGSTFDLAALRSDTESFLRSQQATLPTYADPQQSLIEAVEMVLGGDGFGFPTTLVLGRDTTIRGVWVGYSAGMERDVEAAISELLDEPAAAGANPAAADTDPAANTDVDAPADEA